MGFVQWRNPELPPEAEPEPEVDADSSAPRADGRWRLAVVDLDAIHSLRRFVVRVRDDVTDLRAGLDAAFANARDRGAFTDLVTEAISWPEALAHISRADLRAAGIEVLGGPVQHVTLGVFERLAVREPEVVDAEVVPLYDVPT
jgi:hypothetical protein